MGNLDSIIVIGFIISTGLAYYFLSSDKNQYNKNQDNKNHDNKNQDNKTQEKKKSTVNKAKKIIIEHFKNKLEKNKNITIEEAILDFEKSKSGDLKTFAKNKNRTTDLYIRIYKPFFNMAKNKINK